jgi:hypothetical protein
METSNYYMGLRGTGNDSKKPNNTCKDVTSNCCPIDL